jgi:hypothetical protein
MKELSARGADAIADIARRHGFSLAATRHMLDAVIRGNGSMAQFDHPEFAGRGQWMRGGAAMVSTMFDHDLKSWIDALCLALADLVAHEPALFREPPLRANGAAALASKAPAARIARSGDWWPAGMGHPNNAGAQNGFRYAYFARAKRLAIERHGEVTLYDTQSHEIRGVAQQQSASHALRFMSAEGVVELASLRVVVSTA